MECIYTIVDANTKIIIKINRVLPMSYLSNIHTSFKVFSYANNIQNEIRNCTFLVESKIACMINEHVLCHIKTELS